MADAPESSPPRPPGTLAEMVAEGTSVIDLPLAHLTPGQVVFQRYRLEREIGRGAMGVVWAAHDQQLDLAVALKFLPAAVTHDTEAMRELARETRTGLQLTHAGIVRIYTLEQAPPLAAIAMELVEGESLAVRKARAPNGCLAVEELAPLVAQLCAALEHAHVVARVAHRDLKPGNLLVTPEGRLKITDFGIARSLSDTRTRLTSGKGLTSGTLLYMSPQQLRGAQPSAADDLYALGSTLYELLTGKPPFYRGDVYAQVLHEPPPRLERHRAEVGASGPPIPAHWEETILACLAKDPAQRPASADEVAARLRGERRAEPPRLAPLVPASLSEEPTRMASPADLGQGGDAGRAKDASRANAATPTSFSNLATIAAQPIATEAGPPHLDGADGAARARRRRGWLVAMAVLAAVVLGVGGWWAWRVFSDRGALVVTLDPADVPARLRVDQQAELLVENGHATLRDLPDGDHDLVVLAEAHQPFHGRITSPAREPLVVKLTPVRGAVIVVGRSGSVVTAIDARRRSTLLGTIPASGELAAENTLLIGRYTFQLVHADCAPVEQGEVELATGRVARVAPAQVTWPAALRLTTTPGGAEVRIAGKAVGVTPLTVSDLPSERALPLEVQLRGHRPVRQELTLKPKETRELALEPLRAEGGNVELKFVGAVPGSAGAEAASATPAAVAPQVRIDGLDVTPEPGGTWRFEGVEIGARRVEVLHPDYETWSGTAQVRDGQTVAVRVELRGKPGTLLLTTQPANARVVLDGNLPADLMAKGEPPAVRTPVRRDLPAGRYTARLELLGYQTVERSFVVTANRATELAVTLEELKGPDVAQPWTIPDLGITLEPVAPGTFAMGSTKGDADERPITRVSLTRRYWLGQTEVTQAQWRSVMESAPSGFKGDDRPVEQVSWEDAMAFCRKLTVRERAAGRVPQGFEYTLPTEAQWEFASRTGGKSEQEDAPESVAWFAPNSGGQTHVVGEKNPNAWDLFDMRGNVAEWCYDWHGPYPGGDVIDPVGPETGTLHVYRGGGWDDAAARCRSTDRGAGRADVKARFIGFRVALSPVR